MQTSLINEKQSTQYNLLTVLAILAVVIIPLLLAFSWGIHFADDVYTTLQAGRNLLGATTLHFIEPAPVALLLSAVGWSVLGFAYLLIGWQWKRPFAAAIATLLLSFNPFILLTLGRATSWALALLWLTIVLGLMRRWLLLLFASLGLILTLWFAWPAHEAGLLAFAWTLIIFLAIVGLDRLVAWFAERNELRLGYRQTSLIILGIVFFVVAIWQISNLGQMYQTRPFSQWQLEQEIADWLRVETGEDMTLHAPAKIAYLAQRPFLPYSVAGEDTTATTFIAALQANPPDYVLGSNDIIWKNVEENLWFRLAYEPVRTFANPHDPQAPYTIWAYRPPQLGPDERIAVNVRVPDRLQILGYEMTPNVVQPGASVEMALYFETPTATAVSLTPFNAIIRLVSPLDNSTVTEWQIDLPQTMPEENRQPGQQILEQFSLPIPADVAPGGYFLNLSLIGAEDEGMWPFSRNNDINPLDRIPLEPIAVPQDGNLVASTPLAVNFAHGIQLNGFAANEAQPGQPLDVTLFWQAAKPSAENYVVFVHLLDENGQLVTNHDGVPGNGRFPTTTWQPDINIADTHTLTIPPDIPSGNYQIKVGLYQPETGERLPLIDGTEQELFESAFTLMQLTIEN